jgi:hypothetical protein
MKSTLLAFVAILLLTACGATPQSDDDMHKDTNIHSMDNSTSVGSCNMKERMRAMCR